MNTNYEIINMSRQQIKHDKYHVVLVKGQCCSRKLSGDRPKVRINAKKQTNRWPANARHCSRIACQKNRGFCLDHELHIHIIIMLKFWQEVRQKQWFFFLCLTPFCEQPMVSSFEMSRLHCFPKSFRLAVAVVGAPSQHLRSSWNNVHRVHTVCHWLRVRHGQGQQVRVFVDVGTSCSWESAESHVAPAAGLIWRTGMALQVCPILYLLRFLSECRRMTSWTKRTMAWTAKKWTSGRVVQIYCVLHASISLFLILHSLFLRYSFVWSVGCPVMWSFGHSVNWSLGAVILQLTGDAHVPPVFVLDDVFSGTLAFQFGTRTAAHWLRPQTRETKLGRCHGVFDQ